MVVTASPQSRELTAGLLPVAPAQPPAPGGLAGWARRQARVFRRPELPDTWLQSILSREGPEFEGARLLGEAWYGPVATVVQLGRDFDLVEVPEAVACPAWHYLRWHRAQCGAVFAAGDRWSFVIPARSGQLPWPAEARYLTDCGVSIPARGARDKTCERWWISRPPSGPFTHPLALASALNTFVGSPSSAPPRVAEATDQGRSRTAGHPSSPLCSPGV
ncbi:hypothetical protein M2159_008743 [Streptomyces sp. SAI-090]|nr:hypothetical protein [Streptomyces sp. SAI-090]